MGRFCLPEAVDYSSITVMQALKMIVSGRVQGVGFRRSVENFVAENYLSITGYVKNLGNGNVEVLVQGDIHDLNLVRDFCSEGPPLAEVDSVECIHLQNLENFDSFSVRL